MSWTIAGIAIAATVSVPAFAQGDIIAEQGSQMKYLANSSDPLIGLMWTGTFNDSSWTDGTYGVGYELSPPNAGVHVLADTVVPSGTSSVYTRVTFDVPNLGAVQNVFIGADFDDGWAAWINGQQIYCSPQMPTCTPLWNTQPPVGESSNGAMPNYGTLIDVTTAATNALVQGSNVLAVGVWNQGVASSDLVLVPLLWINRPSVDVTRGPWLQKATQSSLIVRWGTGTVTDSRVRYGTDPAALNTIVDVAGSTQAHSVSISGLAADTTYYYSVGSTTEVLGGGTPKHSFSTLPAVGTRDPYRIWVIGDSGTGNFNAGAVRREWETLSGGTPADAWILLGDNAYQTGTDAEYQTTFFDVFPRVLRNTVVWATIGNHDAVSSNSSNQTGPYFDIFDLPSAGEAGGESSGTEAYYSFDVGNIHFISINSEHADISDTGLMAQWIDLDSGNTLQDWTVAFWHSPPYSKGAHDSDSTIDSGGRLVDMRENIVPILEDNGVDLVLSGHSHSYERTILLDGHHGFSGTLTPMMKIDDGDGQIGGDGAYQKASSGPAADEGTVYITAGNAGLLSGGLLNHPAMSFSMNEFGSVVLDVEGDRMTVRFLDDAGGNPDFFTIVKNSGVLPVADFSATPLTGPPPLDVTFDDLSTTNTAEWAWDFTGDGTDDSAAQEPSNQYTAPGPYTVGLTATNDTGSDGEIKTGFICVTGMPAGAPGLTHDPDGRTLLWPGVGSAANYDVARGDIDRLALTGGDWTMTNPSCIENDDSDLTADDPDRPVAGKAYFYLLRTVGCAGENGTYDSGGASQSAPRDPGITICD